MVSRPLPRRAVRAGELGRLHARQHGKAGPAGQEAGRPARARRPTAPTSAGGARSPWFSRVITGPRVLAKLTKAAAQPDLRRSRQATWKASWSARHSATPTGASLGDERGTDLPGRPPVAGRDAQRTAPMRIAIDHIIHVAHPVRHRRRRPSTWAARRSTTSPSTSRASGCSMPIAALAGIAGIALVLLAAAKRGADGHRVRRRRHQRRGQPRDRLLLWRVRSARPGPADAAHGHARRHADDHAGAGVCPRSVRRAARGELLPPRAPRGGARRRRRTSGPA